MKWNRYAVVGNSGNRHEIVMGRWLQPGKYPFGSVTIIEELDDDKVEEYFKIEQEIYDMWYDTVLSEVE